MTKIIQQPIVKLSLHILSLYVHLLQPDLIFCFGSVWSSLLLGLFSPCGAWASHCGGFSCGGAQAPGRRGSVAAAPGLHSLSTCAGQAWLSSAVMGGFTREAQPVTFMEYFILLKTILY